MKQSPSAIIPTQNSICDRALILKGEKKDGSLVFYLQMRGKRVRRGRPKSNKLCSYAPPPISLDTARRRVLLKKEQNV